MLFWTLASTTNLVLNTVQIAAGNIYKDVLLFILKTDQFWSFDAFSKQKNLKKAFRQS